jgi:hypothetical protein
VAAGDQIVAAGREEIGVSGQSTRGRFIKFPEEWDYQLARVQADGSTYRVALYLLWKARFTGGSVKLANKALEARGVSRWSKYRALDQLGRLGLISTERNGRQSILVKVKFAN